MTVSSKKRRGADQPPDPVQLVLEAAGELFGRFGLKPVVGRTWAALYLSPEELDAESLIERLDRKPESLVNASAIGFYGTRAGNPLTEDDNSTGEFVSTLCRDWEAAAGRIAELGVRVCRLRFGVVLGALEEAVLFHVCVGEGRRGGPLELPGPAQ